MEKIGKVDRRQKEFLQWEAGHICILTKREKNKPLVWSGHTAFNSGQLQPCCRVLVMAILEYKLFTCSNTQTTAGIQVFSSISFCFSLHFCVRVCVCVYLSGFMWLCQAEESIWMKNKTLVACLLNVNTCNWLYFFHSTVFVFRHLFCTTLYFTAGNY